MNEEFAATHQVHEASPATKRGGTQRFRSVTLVRGTQHEMELPPTDRPWVDSLLSDFAGNLSRVRLTVNEEVLSAVNVYSPAWPVARERLVGIDTTGVQLTLNRDLWVGDLLWYALKSRSGATRCWVVAGDFNTSETFDAGRGGPRGNREYLDRMESIGMVDALRTFAGELVPTFRNPRDGQILHQLDHLFLSEPLLSRVTNCTVGCRDKVFGQGLSDHLPIIADLDRDASRCEV